MNHGVRDFHAGWKTVENQPANFSFQNCDQIGEVEKVLFGAVDR